MQILQKDLALYQTMTTEILYNTDWQGQLDLLEWSSPWPNHERTWTYAERSFDDFQVEVCFG